jgi:hypothetical protein
VLAMEAATRNAMHSEQLNRTKLAAQRWSIVLLVLNFIGAVVYVVRASNGWVIPQERALGLHSVTGEPYIWALSVFPSLCCLPCVEFDVGSVHPRPKTMAKRNLLAIDNSDLAGRSGNRFRAPLTMIGEKIAIAPRTPR